MIRLIRFSSLVLLVLIFVLSFPLTLMAQDEGMLSTTSSIVDISVSGTMTPLEKGSTTLVRQADGVSMMFHTFDLTPGDAYTIWWDIQGTNYFADGQIIGEDGMGIFTAFLPIDDTRHPFDPMVAEIKLIARTHGPIIPEIVEEMISTAEGGCDINRCANVQESIHRLPLLADQAEISQATQNIESATRIIQDIWNEPVEEMRGDVGAELYPVQFAFHRPIDVDVPDCSGAFFLEIISMYHQNIANLHIEVETMIAYDDRVVVHYTLTGTPGGTSMRMPDGTSIVLPDESTSWDGVFIYRFENGKVAEEWWYWDNPFAE